MFTGDLMPSLELAAYVRSYRIVDFVFPAGQIIPFKAYPPRPQHSIYFYPKDPERVQYQDGTILHTGVQTSLIGQQTVSCKRYVTHNFMTLQVVFQPGVLHRIIGIAAEELNNCYLDAELVLGKGISLVNEQLFHASDYQQMIQIVETYLKELIRTIKKDVHSVDKIGLLMSNTQQVYSIDWYCQQACLSPRQFERKFKEHVGVSPKFYARLIRFDHVFRMKNRYPDLDWLSLALYCGYYDYQHLVKDYKDFTGCSPNEFYVLDTQAPERYFGDKET